MAETLPEFFEKLLEEVKNSPPPTFPSRFYNEVGDQLEVYISGECYFAKWIDHTLTLLYSQSDPNKIVGYIIDGISTLFERVKKIEE